MKILIINGPNINMLGIREPEVYGKADYGQLRDDIAAYAQKLGIEAVCYQSNHEGDLIDRIQEAYTDGTEGIVINPGALAHYSYALHDALKSVAKIPAVEVHLTDIGQREDFRRESVTARACVKMIAGHGIQGYFEAMDALVEGL